MSVSETDVKDFIDFVAPCKLPSFYIKNILNLHKLLMFFVKKFFNSNSKSNKTNKDVDSLESDAMPVDSTNLALQSNSINQSRNTNYFSTESNDASLAFESNTTNVNNVNQQVVVQFSNISGLQIGSTYNINNNIKKPDINNEKIKTNKSKTKYPKTITIDAMMKSQDEPSRDILNEIASHLGSDYKNFMRELGFSEGQISAKTIDHSVYGIKEVCKSV